jgi:uncharacterized protein (TIGR03083 family)
VAQTHAWDGLFWEESADIAALRDELPDAELDRPSLCAGWAVRDVVGHMLVGHTTSAPKLVLQLVRYRFNLARGSAEASRRLAQSLTPAQIRSQWRDVVTNRTGKGAVRIIPRRDGYVDHTVHHQDIRRALGRPREIPPDRLTAVLDAAVVSSAPTFSPKKNVAGLSLEATDVAWRHGQGPAVRGSGEALLMAAAGRRVALADLEGEGVAVLSARTGG